MAVDHYKSKRATDQAQIANPAQETDIAVACDELSAWFDEVLRACAAVPAAAA